MNPNVMQAQALQLEGIMELVTQYRAVNSDAPIVEQEAYKRVYAALLKMQQSSAQVTGILVELALATTTCPICGQETPHAHSEQVKADYHNKNIAPYRDDLLRNDGWLSLTYSRPPNKPRSFYLIRGHKIQIPEDDWHNVSYNVYQRVHEWEGFPAEVAQWDSGEQRFMLLHWSGSARVSGKEGRRPVYVAPTHYREIPGFAAIQPSAPAESPAEVLHG